MFDLALQVRLKQARNALQDGRLDEAFAIATDKQIREHRGGQILLEELVGPLLDRAARHQGDGRLREALLDVQRALEAGGNRPEALKLRQEIREALESRDRVQRKDRELLESARRLLREGNLKTGQEILRAASPDISEAGRLQRQAERREKSFMRALNRVREHLERAELAEALRAMEEALKASCRHPDLPELVFELKKATEEQIRQSFAAGRLRLVADLFVRLRHVAGDSLECRSAEELLAMTRKAQSAFRKGDYETARIALGRLQKLVPDSEWIEESLEALTSMERASKTLLMSPLARAPKVDVPAEAGSTLSKAITIATPSSCGDAHSATLPGSDAPWAKQPPEARPDSPPGSRWLLWVDGVGTFLVLTKDRISVGRLGASARPEIALSADISGHHAEILRVEEDYFIVASQGHLKVGGRPMQRKLLSSDDSIELTPRCRLSFHLPTPLSSTAILSLHNGQRIEGDVRKIVLLKEHLILAPRGKGHIETRGSTGKIVLSREPRGLVCRAPDDILLDGASAGREAVVPLGARVQVGEVSFTITDTEGGRG